jgi:hypothetical protein
MIDVAGELEAIVNYERVELSKALVRDERERAGPSGLARFSILEMLLQPLTPARPRCSMADNC